MLRKQAQKTLTDGNFKDALELFRRLLKDPQSDPKLVAGDLQQAWICTSNLGDSNAIDELIESTLEVHGQNWRLLAKAAELYTQIEHHGFLVGGKYRRGWNEQNGVIVNSIERDRVRSLQLLDQAIKLAQNEDNKASTVTIYRQLENNLVDSRGPGQSWKLFGLTDISVLPDVQEGHYPFVEGSAAPVGPDGLPLFHSIPKSWESAKTDGERWRWALAQIVEADSNQLNYARFKLALFSHQQFGVQTLAFNPWFQPRETEDDTKAESGIWELHTLSDEESIAKLANGIRRFKLPDEFNYIKIWRSITENPRGPYVRDAYQNIAQNYEDRRQFPQAAEAWKEAIEKGPNDRAAKAHCQDRLNQIVGNWGMIEMPNSLSAGKPAEFEFKFRNGLSVDFTATAINLPKLIEDIKKELKGNPERINWNKINIESIGYRIVNENAKEYLTGEPIGWKQKLDPRENHWDKRITIKAPVEKGGVYLLTSKMEDGNSSRVLMWVHDSVIVRKPLDNKVLFMVLDARTGQPIPKANIEFFGYKQEFIEATRKVRIVTSNFAEQTDAQGMAIVATKDLDHNFQWMTIAREQSGKLAFLGFQGIWGQQRYDAEYNEIKTFTITDRPVYRPKQVVHVKLWQQVAKYDIEDASPFAGQTIHVRMNNPKGETVFDKQLQADEYGGVHFDYELPVDAVLGQYVIYNDTAIGGNIFRVEEYKKPEFEVTIDAPKDPVQLGEKVAAKVTAKYYFGAPVTKATVKYKVTRSTHESNWYPVAPWDWCYGPGYWWFSYDYPWYPGFTKWAGCMRPLPWWIFRQSPPPDVVAEGESAIGEDGTFPIDIDTSLAKAFMGNSDHEYSITAEVRDESRRTIVGSGKVLVAREPFKIFSWVDRGYYRVGDVVEAHFRAQTVDSKPVQGKGKLELLKISYEGEKPVENLVSSWDLDTNVEGLADMQFKASARGQYRISYKLKDEKNHEIEGGYIFSIVGDGFDGSEFRFADIELVPEKREYVPGDKIRLQVNTSRAGSSVYLFLRPTNGVYLEPKLILLPNKSEIVEIPVDKRDMPNFFIEAVTVAEGRIYTETKEIVVPPEKRVLNVTVLPSQERYRPGEKAKVKVRLTDHTGENFQGSTVISVYDKSVEYISGGSNTPDIREFFWKWRRHHNPNTISNLNMYSYLIHKNNEKPMSPIGVFGNNVAEANFGAADGNMMLGGSGGAPRAKMMMARGGPPMAAAPGGPGGGGFAESAMPAEEMAVADALGADAGGSGGGQLAEPTVRSNFADTAHWTGKLETNAVGEAEIEIDMPQNLTTWKIKVWGIGHGTKVGSGSADVITSKDLIVRMQAPRFFVERDEVVLSANVHNYLKGAKTVVVKLDLLGSEIESLSPLSQTIEVAAGGEARIDWRVQAKKEGTTKIRMSALTDEESDAMEMEFPVRIHGAFRHESWAKTIRDGQGSGTVQFNIPAEIRRADSRLEVRYSPTLAGAMVDALPYLADYPHGCTEQTLNRWLPSVITQRILIDMNLDLNAIKEKQTNLNAQELGDDRERTKRWANEKNPVYDREVVNDMVRKGLKDLTEMQLSDGGWGWFSGFGEKSYPHTTATVVRGLQIARSNDVALVPGMLERGVAWLENYQKEQVVLIKRKDKNKEPWKNAADNLDAVVYSVLVEEGVDNAEMRELLYRDRNGLSVYSKVLVALAVHKVGDADKLAMLRRNIEQFLVVNPENETAYLELQDQNSWWYWYGDRIETNAAYLKLVSKLEPKGEVAHKVVKYLLNNRRVNYVWKSTRDTAFCIEAFADYIRASGEAHPDMTVEVWLDGAKKKEVKISSENLFQFDNKFVLTGEDVTTGEHTLELRRIGGGPLYFNSYLTTFSLADRISESGVEIRVNREYYRLIPELQESAEPGLDGLAVKTKTQKFRREKLDNLATVKSGDLIEVELVVKSMNDYEYVLFEDMKPAGFEPVDLTSGYSRNSLGAYVEFRDEKVSFYLRQLSQGDHSLSYRMRAEIPGTFSALPSQIEAMYAPELRGNSNEIRLNVEDSPVGK